MLVVLSVGDGECKVSDIYMVSEGEGFIAGCVDIVHRKKKRWNRIHVPGTAAGGKESMFY